MVCLHGLLGHGRQFGTLSGTFHSYTTQTVTFLSGTEKMETRKSETVENLVIFSRKHVSNSLQKSAYMHPNEYQYLIPPRNLRIFIYH